MAQQRAPRVSAAASLLLVLLAAAAVRAQAQPLQEQTAEEAEGMESLPPPLRYLLVQRLLDARLAAADRTRPLSPEAALARDLMLLANAVAANQGFHKLDVAHSSIKTYCHLDNNRQCREACFYFGDSACIDGNLAFNGNDNAHLSSGFHPGK